MFSTYNSNHFGYNPVTIRLGLINFLLALSIFAHAQGLMSKDSTAQDEQSVLIPIENISAETKSLLLLIDNMNSVIDAQQAESSYDSMFIRKFNVIVDLKKRVKLSEIEDSDYFKAERLKTYIAPIRLLYDTYMQSISARIESLSKGLNSIEIQEKRWRQTYEIASTENWLPALRNRIRDNIREIEGISGRTKKLYNQLLFKQEEVTSDIVYLHELSRRIQLVEDHYTSLIFTSNDPSIWEIFQSRDDASTLGERINQAKERQKQTLELFFASSKTNLYYHLLFFIILLVVLVIIKNEVSKWSEEKKDADITRSLYVINHPISSSILISVLLCRLFYPQAPPDALEYFYFLLIIPILKLIPGIYPTVPRKYFHIIALLFLIVQLLELVRELQVLDRFSTLILAIITILFLASIQIGKTAFEKETKSVNWKWVGFLVKVSMVLLSISVISNILGNTVLTEILVNGVFTIIFGGLIIFSTRRVAKGLFYLLLQQKKIAKMNIIVNHEEVVKEKFLKILNITAVSSWVINILDSFMVLRPLFNWLSRILSRAWQLGSLELTIGSLLGFFFTIWLTILISKFVRFILQEEILTHFQLKRGIPWAIALFARLTLLVIGFTIALGLAKIDLSNITIIIGALGVGIGFGLQNIFNNLISGIILAVERPIQIGDMVQLSSLDITGEVKEIGLRASIIRSFDGAEIVVPNGNFISNEMINWTLSDKKRRQEIIVGVAYGTNTTKVLEILSGVIASDPQILKNPSPAIFFNGFGESSLNFRLLFWTHFDNGLSSKSNVGIAINNEFAKEGIEIPFPQRDLHLKTDPLKISMNPDISATKNDGSKE